MLSTAAGESKYCGCHGRRPPSRMSTESNLRPLESKLSIATSPPTNYSYCATRPTAVYIYIPIPPPKIERLLSTTLNALLLCDTRTIMYVTVMCRMDDPRLPAYGPTCTPRFPKPIEHLCTRPQNHSLVQLYDCIKIVYYITRAVEHYARLGQEVPPGRPTAVQILASFPPICGLVFGSALGARLRGVLVRWGRSLSMRLRRLLSASQWRMYVGFPHPGP